MKRPGRDISILLTWALVAAALLLSRCDTVEPEEGEQLVVETFLDAGKPLPAVTLRQTNPLGQVFDADRQMAEGAEVRLTLNGTTIMYQPAAGQPGQYLPENTTMSVSPRANYSLAVRWQDQEAIAQGRIPPPIVLDSIQVHVPENPVQAVLLDSLNLGLDSLNVELPAAEGFMYPVEVTLWWRTDLDEPGADTLYWIQTQLNPFMPTPSTVADFFLLPEQILLEGKAEQDALGNRHWTGVYAVPVLTEGAPLPPHELKVGLLRSHRDYANFATTRNAPDRREPISNVTGAIGIVAGISVDSVQVQIR